MECHQNTHHLECTGCSPKEYEPIAIRKDNDACSRRIARANELITRE